jgi:L-iditol 2-dehydrogenase
MKTVPTRMRALVFRGGKGLEVETVSVPRIGPGELLVRVQACGVCPTDIKKIDNGSADGPRIFGHETAGVVVKTGALVKGFGPGDRVVLHHHVPCLQCHACLRRNYAQCPQFKKTGVTAGFEPAGGGFAEYVRVMRFVLPGVVALPEENAFEEGAMLEPVNTVLKAIVRLSLIPGDKVWVVGQGPIGLLFTRLLSLRGMQVFANDFWKERLKISARMGAFRTRAGEVREDGAREWTDFDAVIVTVPADGAVKRGFERARGGGSVLLFGHTTRGKTSALDFSRVCVEEKTLLGSYSADFSLQSEVAELVFSRKLDLRPLITHRYPLEKAAEAIDLVRRAEARSLKVVVGVAFEQELEKRGSGTCEH